MNTGKIMGIVKDTSDAGAPIAGATVNVEGHTTEGQPVTRQRTANAPTEDLPLWVIIRNTTRAISFGNYRRFMDILLCEQPNKEHLDKVPEADGMFNHLRRRRYLPCNDADAYGLLKVATEAFLMVNCGVAASVAALKLPFGHFKFTDDDLHEVIRRVAVNAQPGDLDNLWDNYLKPIMNGNDDETIPYLALVRDKLSDLRLKNAVFPVEGNDLPEECYGILRTKLTHPCLLELIWSYWHEEGMLVQTMNAIRVRFQNVRRLGERDPLAMVENDPLRPLSNLIWGYLQDEQHRLGVERRAYEYDHHYGLTLHGKTVPTLRPTDSRAKFLEAFHNLLYLCAIFYKEDDDTTVIADGLLNALREVHFLLAEGAHNQFGDLPSTARQEMLIQQWLLARPEFLQFLPTRIMVAYPEPWMDRVDAMKTLQGWTDVSVIHFQELGTFGEQILLSIRFGAWSIVHDSVQASNWARFWRAEIQGYTHAYRAVTGVDLTS